MRVCACDVLEVVINVVSCVGRGSPGVAEFDDYFSDLGDEGDVTVCGTRGE